MKKLLLNALGIIGLLLMLPERLISAKQPLLKALGIIGLLILLLALLLGIAVAGEKIDNFFTPGPPRPEITYGEFPFRVEYEKNGERIVVEDTIICKFNGFSSISCSIRTKHREWKASFASGRAIPFGAGTGAYLEVDGANQLFLSLGGAGYYMGDGWGGAINCTANKYTKNFGGYSLKKIDPDELFNIYGIKVISYEFSPPIVNTFK